MKIKEERKMYSQLYIFACSGVSSPEPKAEVVCNIEGKVYIETLKFAKGPLKKGDEGSS